MSKNKHYFEEYYDQVAAKNGEFVKEKDKLVLKNADFAKMKELAASNGMEVDSKTSKKDVGAFLLLNRL